MATRSVAARCLAFVLLLAFLVVAQAADYYKTLGLNRGASDDQIKRAYRKLVGQYHPDRLVSQGLPEEMMEKAKNRVREINTAYDQIKQARGFK